MKITKKTNWNAPRIGATQVKLIEKFEANRSKALDRFQIATNSAKWKNLLLNINKTTEQER